MIWTVSDGQCNEQHLVVHPEKLPHASKPTCAGILELVSAPGAAQLTEKCVLRVRNNFCLFLKWIHANQCTEWRDNKHICRHQRNSVSGLCLSRTTDLRSLLFSFASTSTFNKFPRAPLIWVPLCDVRIWWWSCVYFTGNEAPTSKSLISEFIRPLQTSGDKPELLSVKPTLLTRSRARSPARAFLSEVTGWCLFRKRLDGFSALFFCRKMHRQRATLTSLQLREAAQIQTFSVTMRSCEGALRCFTSLCFSKYDPVSAEHQLPRRACCSLSV